MGSAGPYHFYYPADFNRIAALNNNNTNGGGNTQLRFSHLINTPLNLQLTLIDRDFNSNDYEMLLALDSDNQSHGAEKEQIDLLPLHCLNTKKDIDSLSSTCGSTTTTTTTGEEESKKDCSICLEIFKEGDFLRTLPCLHHFHSNCVDKWLKIKTVCPICKCEVF
eukprot:gene7418-9119_t